MGGGIYVEVGHLICHNSEIRKNRGTNYGGGLFMEDGLASVTNCTFADNIAPGLQQRTIMDFSQRL